MTAQINDTIKFNNEYFSIVGVAGEPLVTLELFGTESQMHDTFCYRGFYVLYELTGEGLCLRELTMCRWERDYVPIDGVLPTREHEDDDYPTYRNLNIPVPFTGQICLARDFISKSAMSTWDSRHQQRSGRFLISPLKTAGW